MKKRDWIVLAVIVNHGYENYKTLMRRTGYSLGFINSSLKKLIEEGFIDSSYNVTEKTRIYMEEVKPRRAVILAAGMGLKMMPVNENPKGLIQINNEPLIERVIKQLQAVGVNEIYAVVGYKMESFEYLTDKYGIELIYNYNFTKKDSLHSLKLAADKLSNCYIVPCCVWFANNPFHEYEYFSWYAIAEYFDEDSFVRQNRKMELIYTDGDEGGNSMVGLCYLREKEGVKLRKQLINMDEKRRNAREPWEKALLFEDKMIAYARIMLGQSAYEIRTYEQLRELDGESRNIKSKWIHLISEVFGVEKDEITDISRLFLGMTNLLMRFSVKGKPYLLRIPGEGTSYIIDRWQEEAVYSVLNDRDYADRIVCIFPEDGYKITEFFDNSHNCNPSNENDVAACIKHLRKLHNMRLEVPHSFNLMEKLEQYEKLCKGQSLFSDYDETRQNVVRLIDMLNTLPKDNCLCHIDPVSDNFLLVGGKVYLVDWEYAGMCDPHIDIAMFCIYANYDKNAADRVIDLYYENKASDLNRLKVYAYASAAAFMWTVWCDYKEKLGISYSQYTMNQYKIAKKFYKHAMQLAEKLDIAPSAKHSQ